MTASSTLRGHEIVFVNGCWRFRDTMESTERTWHERPCGKCGLHNTPDGHDACLGALPGVRNACCGHGEVAAAYIDFEDGRHAQGQEAVDCFGQLKKAAKDHR
jgi:hypothetical protein